MMNLDGEVLERWGLLLLGLVTAITVPLSFAPSATVFVAVGSGVGFGLLMGRFLFNTFEGLR